MRQSSCTVTLLWAPGTAEALAAIRATELAGDAYLRLVRRLAYLENDASGFEAVYGVVTTAGPIATPIALGSLMAHVVEADPGHVFVVLYRLIADSEDVLIVGLRYDA